MLLCLPLIGKVEAQPKVFVVNGAGGGSDGVFAEEGKGADHRYQRMGGADTYGHYYYLYRGTERADTWVVGRGRSFEERVAIRELRKIKLKEQVIGNFG